MTKSDIDIILSMVPRSSVVGVWQLADKSDRVLLLGFNDNGDTFTVKLIKEKIDIRIGDYYHGCSDGYDVRHLIPSGFVCPYGSDFEFCRLLVEMGGFIMFADTNMSGN